MITKESFIDSVDDKVPENILKLWLKYIPYLNEYGFVNKSFSRIKIGQYRLEQDASEYGKKYVVYISFHGRYKHTSYDLKNYPEFYDSYSDLLYVPRIDVLIPESYIDSYSERMSLRKEIASDWRLDLWNYGRLKSKIELVLLKEDRDDKRNESRRSKRERASSSKIKFLRTMDPIVYLSYSKYDKFLTRYNFQSIYEDQNIFQVKRNAREYGFSYILQISFPGTTKYIVPTISMVKNPFITDEQEKEVLDDWADDLIDNYNLNVQIIYRHGNSGNWYDKQRREENRQSYWNRWRDQYNKQYQDNNYNRQRAYTSSAYNTEWWKVLEFSSMPTDFASVKKRYRELAFKYHPYKNPNNKTAEETMKKINDAYDKAKQYYRSG